MQELVVAIVCTYAAALIAGQPRRLFQNPKSISGIQINAVPKKTNLIFMSANKCHQSEKFIEDYDKVLNHFVR